MTLRPPLSIQRTAGMGACGWGHHHTVSATAAAAATAPSGRQPRHQVGRQKRRVAREAGDVGDVRIGDGRPVEPGQHARQRPDEPLHTIGDDR